MNLNDPRIARALRAYEQEMVARRRLEEVQRSLPARIVPPDVLPSAGVWKQVEQAPPAWTKLVLLPPATEPRPVLQQHLKELERLGGFLSSVFDMVRSFLEPVVMVVSRIVEGLRPVVGALTAVGSFLEKMPGFLPALEELLEAAKRFEQAWRDGDATLEAAEYGFADDLWDMTYVAGFAHVHPGVRDAVVTKKLLAVTRTDDFGEELRDRFGRLRATRRRWPPVEAAFEAHQRGEYLLSIPAMLPQVEGAIVDAMVLKGLTVRKNGRLYLRGDDDRPKKGEKSGKRLPEITLHRAVSNARLEERPELEGVSSFVADSLVQKRNAVLHGRDVRYDKAKLSVQSLLVLALLTEAVGELEAAKKAARG